MSNGPTTRIRKPTQLTHLSYRPSASCSRSGRQQPPSSSSSRQARRTSSSLRPWPSWRPPLPSCALRAQPWRHPALHRHHQQPRRLRRRPCLSCRLHKHEIERDESQQERTRKGRTNYTATRPAGHQMYMQQMHHSGTGNVKNRRGTQLARRFGAGRPLLFARRSHAARRTHQRPQEPPRSHHCGAGKPRQTPSRPAQSGHPPPR